MRNMKPTYEELYESLNNALNEIQVLRNVYNRVDIGLRVAQPDMSFCLIVDLIYFFENAVPTQ